MTFAPINTESPFVEENPYFPPEFSQFLLKMSDYAREFAPAINQREICAYVANEIITGSTLFSDLESQNVRPVFRKVVQFGALPNTTSKSVPHEIDVMNTYQFIKILVIGNNPSATGTTPYATVLANKDSRVDITLSNIVITTTADYSAFTVCSVILEYTKTM